MSVVHTIINGLSCRDDFERFKVTRLFRFLPNTGHSAKLLTQIALTDSDRDIREHAKYEVSKRLTETDVGTILSREDILSVVDLLITALKGGRDELRASAAMILGGFGERASHAVQYLIPLIQQPGEPRDCAVIALNQIMGPAAVEALPSLVAAIPTSIPLIRSVLYRIIGRLTSRDNPVAVKALRDGLEDGSLWSRFTAAESLVNLGLADDRVRRVLFEVASRPQEFEELAEHADELLAGKHVGDHRARQELDFPNGR